MKKKLVNNSLASSLTSKILDTCSELLKSNYEKLNDLSIRIVSLDSLFTIFSIQRILRTNNNN